jgi:hypothetical protein
MKKYRVKVVNKYLSKTARPSQEGPTVQYFFLGLKMKPHFGNQIPPAEEYNLLARRLSIEGVLGHHARSQEDELADMYYSAQTDKHLWWQYAFYWKRLIHKAYCKNYQELPTMHHD